MDIIKLVLLIIGNIVIFLSTLCLALHEKKDKLTRNLALTITIAAFIVTVIGIINSIEESNRLKRVDKTTEEGKRIASETQKQIKDLTENNSKLINLQIEPILNYDIHIMPPFDMVLYNSGNVDIKSIAIYLDHMYFEIKGGEIESSIGKFLKRNPGSLKQGSFRFIGKLDISKNEIVPLSDYIKDLVKKRVGNYVFFKVSLFYQHPINKKEYNKSDYYLVAYDKNNTPLFVQNMKMYNWIINEKDIPEK